MDSQLCIDLVSDLLLAALQVSFCHEIHYVQTAIDAQIIVTAIVALWLSNSGVIV